MIQQCCKINLKPFLNFACSHPGRGTTPSINKLTLHQNSGVYPSCKITTIEPAAAASARPRGSSVFGKSRPEAKGRYTHLMHPEIALISLKHFPHSRFLPTAPITVCLLIHIIAHWLRPESKQSGGRVDLEQRKKKPNRMQSSRVPGTMATWILIYTRTVCNCLASFTGSDPHHSGPKMEEVNKFWRWFLFFR